MKRFIVGASAGRKHCCSCAKTSRLCVRRGKLLVSWVPRDALLSLWVPRHARGRHEGWCRGGCASAGGRGRRSSYSGMGHPLWRAVAGERVPVARRDFAMSVLRLGWAAGCTQVKPPGAYLVNPHLPSWPALHPNIAPQPSTLNPHTP